MFSQEVMDMLIKGIGETLYMTLGATIFGYVLGLPMGILMTTTAKDGIRPNAGVYKVLDVIVNIGRSIPFLILLILLMPLTKAIVGKSYGSTATIVPLVISAAPFIARMVESSLNEVDAGVIEAAINDADYHEGDAGGGKNFTCCGGDDYPRHSAWLLSNGRYHRRLWSW